MNTKVCCSLNFTVHIYKFWSNELTISRANIRKNLQVWTKLNIQLRNKAIDKFTMKLANIQSLFLAPFSHLDHFAWDLKPFSMVSTICLNWIDLRYCTIFINKITYIQFSWKKVVLSIDPGVYVKWFGPSILTEVCFLNFHN